MANPRQKRATAKKAKAKADTGLTGWSKVRRTADGRNAMSTRVTASTGDNPRKKARAKARAQVSKKRPSGSLI